MANVKVYNMSGAEVGTIELSDAVFGVEINEHVMHLAVKQYLANQRQGTQSAKTRSEVRGGGKKPFRQKGTGRARQGSIRAPQWTGGGVVFVLSNINAGKALIVMEGSNKNAILSARNIPEVKTASVNTINTYDVLKYNTLVVTKEAVAKIEEVYA